MPARDAKIAADASYKDGAVLAAGGPTVLPIVASGANEARGDREEQAALTDALRQLARLLARQAAVDFWTAGASPRRGNSE